MMEDADPICRELPAVLSSFVETFVDFSVADLFLPPLPQNPNPSANPPSRNNFSNAFSPPPLRPQTRHPAPERMIVVGDVHGDLGKLKEALRLADLVDACDRWIGGATTVVQIGDVLDRGGQELKILYFLEKLKREAWKVGGRVLTMNGNHEIMNVEGDFRYVTESGLDEFKAWGDWFCIGNSMKRLCKGLPKPRDPFAGIPPSFENVKGQYFSGFRARIAALRPDGPIASRFLCQNMTVLVVGESILVHGGVLPQHVGYGLERINKEVRGWMKGRKGGRLSPSSVRGRDSVVWSRRFSHEAAMKCDCSTLEYVLSTIPGARRMIMGHTIQENGINGVCENKAIRIDVGMSEGCVNGLPEVLEVSRDSEIRVLTSNPLYMKEEAAASLQSGRKDGLGLLLPVPRPVQVES